MYAGDKFKVLIKVNKGWKVKNLICSQWQICRSSAFYFILFFIIVGILVHDVQMHSWNGTVNLFAVGANQCKVSEYIGLFWEVHSWNRV